MNQIRPESLLKLENLLNSFKDAEKKAAKFILEHAEEVVNMTISELAAESSVSETTVFRLCRALDYPGFRAFKIDLARQGSMPQNPPLKPVQASDDAETVAHNVFNITIQTLQETLQVIDFNELERAYAALKNARKVLVLALSVSRSTAIFTADKFCFFGLDARAELDIHFQTMRAATLTPKDVLFAFSRSGDTRDLIEATQVAKERGATTIGVTNNPRSFFAKHLDIQLISKSKDTRFRDDLLASRIEHISVVDVLYTMLASRNPKRCKSHYSLMHDAAVVKQY